MSTAIHRLVPTLQTLQSLVKKLEITLESDDISLVDIMIECRLSSSKGEAKRLIQQNGVSVFKNGEEEKVSALDYKLTIDELKQGVKIKKGKKVFHKAILG